MGTPNGKAGQDQPKKAPKRSLIPLIEFVGTLLLLVGLLVVHPLFCPVSLFGTMDFGRLEVAHTRTLAWLLDPHGTHGFGNTLAAALLRFAFDADIPSFEIHSVDAERTLLATDETGRADIGETEQGGRPCAARPGATPCW